MSEITPVVIMALIDGELSPTERTEVLSRIQQSPELRNQYEKLRTLSSLSNQLPPPPSATPSSSDLDHYWHGVCRKMENRACFKSWAKSALGLAVIGNLLLFGYGGSVAGQVLGAVTVMSGLAVLWMSYYCTCSRRPAHIHKTH